MDGLLKEKLEHIACMHGAASVRFIPVSEIPLAQWPRMKCQYGCANYNKTLCCPPYTPSLKEMQQFVREYETAMVVEYKGRIEGDTSSWESLDKKWNLGLLDILLAVEKEAFLSNLYKAFAMKAGRCRLCETCSLTTCRHPDKARPSAEACGIDVFLLAKRAGYEIAVFDKPVTEFSIYGVVLLE